VTLEEAVRVAHERVRLVRFQLRSARMERSTAENHVERPADALEEKRRRLRITDEDLTERVLDLENRRAQLADERRQIEGTIEQARSTWRSALEKGAEEARVEALDGSSTDADRIAVLSLRRHAIF
jgi:hypothetical protein